MLQEFISDMTYMNNRVIVVESEFGGWRIDRFLAARLEDWSRVASGLLVREGYVRINGKLATKGSAHVHAGDSVHIDPDGEAAVRKSREFAMSVRDFGTAGDVQTVVSEDIPLDVVYEDDDVLVVDKPAGMVVHPAYKHASGTLVNAVAGYLKKKGLPVIRRVGLVHRLDKDVSGLVVIAKNEAAHRVLAKQFSSEGITSVDADLSRKAHKYYWAVVGPISQREVLKRGIGSAGSPKAIEGYVWRAMTDRRNVEFGHFPGAHTQARYALSFAQYVKPCSAQYHVVEIQIVTGRMHQIRAQLSFLGLPIVGDVRYGGDDTGEATVRLRCVGVSLIPPRVLGKPGDKTRTSNGCAGDMQAERLLINKRTVP